MTDTTETKTNNADQEIGLVFDFDQPDTFILRGSDKVFTECENEKVRALYANKPFSLKVKNISPERLAQIRRSHTKIKATRRGQISETNNFAMTIDLFVECVVSWRGIGPKQGGPLRCDAEMKRIVAKKAWDFANIVASEAIDCGDAVAREEAAEVERFR